MAPYVPIERCRLVKYDDYSETMDQSFDLEEVHENTCIYTCKYVHYYLLLFSV